MNTRTMLKLMGVCLIVLASGCGQDTINDLANDDAAAQGLRSAPRMLFHNEVGDLTAGLAAPARVAATAGAFYVADPLAKAIVEFDSTTFTETVYELEVAPVGIGTDGLGNFYVSLINGAVVVYDAAFTDPPTAYAAGVVDFVQPTDIAYGAGTLYILDTGADAYYAFDDLGALLYSVGGRGSAQGEFKAPSSIAVDALNSLVVVADQDNYRIQVFDLTGAFQYAFGYRVKYVGTGVTSEGWLARSAGVAVDAGGFIYVADGLLGKVRIYEQGGGELGEVLGHEDHFGGLTNPADMAFDALGRLLLVNTGGGGLKVYEAEPPGDLRQVISQNFLGANPGIGAEIRGWDAPHMETDVSCSRCHNFDDQPGGHLGLTDGQANLCLSCHTSGGQAPDLQLLTDASNSHPWGVSAVNAGAGSEGPSEDGPLADYLDAGDIKCATCHDQHANSGGEPYLRITLQGDSLLCGDCHLQAEQWKVANHSDEDSQAFNYPTGPGREACAQCHTGLGYIDYAAGVPLPERRTDKQVISCWICHQTHGTSNPTIMRIYDEAILPGDYVVTGAQEAATCMTCHNGRRAPEDPGLTPHYALGGATLVGINGVEFGCNIPNSFHGAPADNAPPNVLCMRCHMADTPAEGQPGHNKVGGHTFNIVYHQEGDPDDGFENAVIACGGCHPGLTTVNRPAADYDGDGLAEGVQDEVQGLLDLVFPEILNTGAVFLGHYPYWDLSGVDPGDVQLAEDAIWNYEYVENDGSLGVHNTGYSVGLLQLTYLQLTGSDVPNTAVLRYNSCPP